MARGVPRDAVGTSEHLSPPQWLLMLSVPHLRYAACVLQNRLGPTRRKNILEGRVVVSVGHK